MSRIFILRGDLLNSTLHSEGMQITYTVTTPHRTFHTETTTITRASYFQPQPTFVAGIEWHSFSSEKFILGGKLVDVKDFLRSPNFLSSSLVFMGPDGREYRWGLGVDPKVTLNNDVRTPVARYHSEVSSLRHGDKPGYLEVYPEGEHILDYIIFTFIYVKKLSSGESAQV